MTWANVSVTNCRAKCSYTYVQLAPSAPQKSPLRHTGYQNPVPFIRLVRWFADSNSNFVGTFFSQIAEL